MFVATRKGFWHYSVFDPDFGIVPEGLFALHLGGVSDLSTCSVASKRLGGVSNLSTRSAADCGYAQLLGRSLTGLMACGQFIDG